MAFFHFPGSSTKHDLAKANHSHPSEGVEVEGGGVVAGAAGGREGAASRLLPQRCRAAPQMRLAPRGGPRGEVENGGSQNLGEQKDWLFCDWCLNQGSTHGV